MEKKNYEKLLDNSLAATLSAIEIYNKPDFKYRNEVFTILIINGWELLLKAKILKDNEDKIESIYALDHEGKHKINRSGNTMTIEVFKAVSVLKLDSAVQENLNKLIEIRDSAIHFYNDEDVDYLIYTLGAASLRNYQHLTKEWFDRSLLEYNFYIMPLCFNYIFKTLSLIELEKKPEAITNLIKSVSESQSKIPQNNGFYFICEISAEVKSAKKLMSGADIVVAIDQDAKNAVVITEIKNLIDQYPLAFRDLMEKVKEKFPQKKYQEIFKLIMQIRSDSKYAAPNFRYKKQEEKFKQTKVLPKGTPTIYSHNALRFILDELEKKQNAKNND